MGPLDPSLDDGGVGLPEMSATLPTTSILYDPTLLQTEGVVPYNMCILNGFNTVLAKTTTNVFPFGVWFANADTLYVADEGDGYAGGAGCAAWICGLRWKMHMGLRRKSEDRR